MSRPKAAKPRRPALRYHGGKWRLAPWIIEHFPAHRTYVEPFAGAASVLLRKDPAYAEVYNDLDGDVVDLFRILRDPVSADQLHRLLTLTPFAREEFEAAYQPSEGPLERARRLVIRSFMGIGSDGSKISKAPTGFRNNTSRDGTIPAHDWVDYADALLVLSDRLRGVVIENRHALPCMKQHDRIDTLHFVDPPYLPDTRKISHRGIGYEHEMTADDHVELLAALRELDGMVVLCGYPSKLYDQVLVGWETRTMAVRADGARQRTECLWLNPACADELAGSLFAGRHAAGSSGISCMAGPA